MSDRLLIDELQDIDRGGYQADTVAAARRDRFQAWMERAPFVRRLAVTHAAGPGNSAASLVAGLVAANLALEKDGATCQGEEYRREVAETLQELRGIIPFSGSAYNEENQWLGPVNLTEGFDPARAWWEFGLVTAAVVLAGALLASFAWYKGPDVPWALSPLGLGGACLTVVLILVLAYLDKNKRLAHRRAAFARQVRRDAKYLDECARDAFPPPGVHSLRRYAS
jgi:hypothetical protein